MLPWATSTRTVPYSWSASATTRFQDTRARWRRTGLTVEAGQMLTFFSRSIPVDPITESAETWTVTYAPWEMLEEGQVAGVCDVHSGAEGAGLDDTPYASW